MWGCDFENPVTLNIIKLPEMGTRNEGVLECVFQCFGRNFELCLEGRCTYVGYPEINSIVHDVTVSLGVPMVSW